MSNKNHKHSPESNRVLVCKGYDWSPFTCEGMFIPYKHNPDKRRFCMKNKNGIYESEHGTWKDIESWEYKDQHDKAIEGKK